MTDSFIFLGREIPLYGIMSIAGIIVSAVCAFFLARKRKNEFFDLLCSSVYVMIGAFIGAKLLFIAVSFKDIIALGIPMENVINGGFVFYGGLIGGAMGLLIYIKQFHMDYGLLEIYSAALPLGHAFGRVGCFFAGCCYGIPYSGFPSHIYTETVGMTPLNVPLLAVQLIEAACLLVIFSCLLIVFLWGKKRYLTPILYIISYTTVRFVLEFFRGDNERGVYWGLSTAQWVSIVLFLSTCIFLLVRSVRNAEKVKEEDKKLVSDISSNGV